MEIDERTLVYEQIPSSYSAKRSQQMVNAHSLDVCESAFVISPFHFWNK